jgi:hypothetical protein
VRKRITIVVVVAVVTGLVAAAGLVALHWWRDSRQSDLERAASYAPGDAQRLSWTDWANIREKVGARLDSSSSGADLADFLDKGYDDDLTSASALVQSAPVLQARFGFSPATADWELFSQSEEGAVVIVRMPDGTDFDALADHLDESGFTRPSSDTGVWTGGDTLLPSLGADLTPELQYVALDAHDNLVLTSDTAEYLQQTVDGLGDQELPQGMRDAITASGDPLSAAVYSAQFACSALAMSQADPSDEKAAEQLIAVAGKINPVTGFAMSVQPGGHVRVVLSFEDDDQARANADSRAELASGPAPGQGGDFGDRFTIGSVTADGSLVTMDLKPRQGAYVFSDLSTGPVLFATC